MLRWNRIRYSLRRKRQVVLAISLLCIILLYLYRVLTLMAIDSKERVQRSVWCKERSKEWWREVVSGLYGESWWLENLRMTHRTFDILCDELRPYIQRQHTRLREPISVEARVAMTIWRLATNSEYRTIAALFGVGRSTVAEVVLDTCETITRQLMGKYVRVPSSSGLREIVDGFLSRWGFPQTVVLLMVPISLS